MKSAAIRGFIKYLLTYEKQQKTQSNPEPPNLMANIEDKTPDSPEDQIKQLQKENNRLQRIIKRHETQLQHLDKMASANEKTNIALYKELEVLQQQAEAQAREAQIEAALERVRARTMGMHKSEELKEVVVVLYKQLDALGLADWGCSIMIFDKEANRIENWVAESSGSELLHCYYVEGQKHPVFKKLWKYWEQQGPPMTLHHTDEVKRELDNYWLNETDFKVLPEEVKSSILNEREIFLSYASMRHGLLSAAGYKRLPDEKIAILERFSKVFEQTYTRFLDLQKAEAQARESQIQLALERVRAKAMSMQNSDELNEVLSVMFEQFDILGIEPKSVHLSLMDIENNRFSFRLTGIKGERNIGEQIIDLNEMPNWAEVVDKWKNSEPHSATFIEYPAELLPKFWEVFHDSIHSIPEHARMQMEDFPNGLFGVGGHNKFGYIGFYHSRRATGEEVNILIRVAREFEGLYQRFLDLQKAEAHAREAVQQASLDRVRAEIASMRSTGDLQRITPLIWRELTTLGVPFFRCGVFIIDEVTELTHAYLSTPLGEAFAALHMKFDSAPFIHAAVEHWRQQQVYREEWNREQFIAWTQSILKLGLIDSPEKYQAGGEAPEKLVLHFVPFTQGMLYIGSSAALSGDEIELSQSLAKTFGMAYARYEDFQRLEAAKAQVEAALENLKKTQQQLVTQEKLASLGQLTAGIAHEIKNPLNFVNNFAALSIDLAQELREEIAKVEDGGSKIVDGERLASIREILETLEQNAEKINHHGKRADSIVKSMMQHARGSSGQREMADINQLLDEAVNLTYHGMRANDPSFNVTIEKEYDESIGKIQVVPQDLSRVFLNLINNACYAAHQKKKASADGFSPTLSVATKSAADKIEIRIRDNGNGIPKDIREKIFNPFFTTKPTGQGTGLGLSISHDLIVQQHRGEIKVETEEGKFTEFVISLRKA
ncbi:MAG: Adaptive-response sensory-kinase SasA [bacterium]|nr:Adaptive-response sensory-kinase SasA [bacterium]